MTARQLTWIGATVAVVAAVAGVASARGSVQDPSFMQNNNSGRRARNVIFFVGDGMGVSTITATRVYSVGVAGQLVVDQFPTRRCRAPTRRTPSRPTARRR